MEELELWDLPYAQSAVFCPLGVEGGVLVLD